MLSIELFNATKDPYRVAPLGKIPVPWPYDRGMASDLGKEMEERFKDDIADILRQYDITPTSVTVLRMWKRGLKSTAADTVVISVEQTDSTTWLPAAEDIYQAILPWARATTIHFRVELRHEARMFTNISTALLHGEDVTDIMTTIRPRIIALVKQAIPESWRAISFHGRQPWDKPYGDMESNKPTVVVQVDIGAVSTWEVIEEQLKGIIDEAAPPSIEIGLEILPCRLEDTVVVDIDDSPPMYQNEVPSAPTNGSSIAPLLVSSEAGSLGPIVKFQPKGSSNVYKCFITCYHVVAGGDPANRAFNDKNGIGFNNLPRAPIRISWPARYDIDFTMSELDEMIADQGTPAREREEMQIEKDMLMKRFPPTSTIGEVLYASGRTTNKDNRRMDWALVAFDRDGPGDRAKNELPMPAAFPVTFRVRGYRFRAEPGDTVIGIGVPKLGPSPRETWVGSFGRTSAAVSGEVNKLRSRTHWLDGMETDEIEIASLASATPFAKGGDSGSLVFNMDHKWIGMTIGAIQLSGYGYVTSAYDLMMDIEERTGGTIFLHE